MPKNMFYHTGAKIPTQAVHEGQGAYDPILEPKAHGQGCFIFS